MKKIVAISGSLRKKSYNTLLLKKIKELLPEDIQYEILDVSFLPLFNEDLELSLPKEIIELKNKISESNLVILSTPEYNYSVSGVLKNALDWFSRGDNPPFEGKNTCILSASVSRFGGARAQSHLRQILLGLGTDVLIRPEVFISDASETIESERTLNQLKKLVNKILENI